MYPSVIAILTHCDWGLLCRHVPAPRGPGSHPRGICALHISLIPRCNNSNVIKQDPPLWANTPGYTWGSIDFLDSEKAFQNFVEFQETLSAIYAVTCTDGLSLTSKNSDDEVVDLLLNATVDTYQRWSTMFAGLVDELQICFHWKARATERFRRLFDSNLANPILIIGNTADVSSLWDQCPKSTLWDGLVDL